MDADLDTLAAALYVRTDDLLNDSPQRIPWRPRGRDRTDDPRRRGGQTGAAVGPSIAVSTMLRYAVLLRRVVELPLESWRLLQ